MGTHQGAGRTLPLVLVLVCGCAGPGGLASVLDRYANPSEPDEPYEISAEGAAFHETLRVVDLHSDALLLGRDLLVRSDRGHTDLPRLIEGNVWVQCFATVTKVPFAVAYRGAHSKGIDADGSDMISLLADSLRWPPEARDGPDEYFHRAMYQAKRLVNLARQSSGRLRVLLYREDLREYLAERVRRRDRTAGILCIEGAQALHGDLSKLDALFAAGFRMLGLVHHFDNEVGGSTHGLKREGLTEFGRQVIRRMGKLGMIVDLAHASPRLIDEVLEEREQLFAPPPIVVSHTGIYHGNPTFRNLTDEQLVSIMDAGGLVGLGYFMGKEEGNTVTAYARMFGHVAGLTENAAAHLALGSDFDGLVATPVDASGLAQVTDALLRLKDGAGTRVLTRQEVRGIMGDNALLLLERALPQRPPAR